MPTVSSRPTVVHQRAPGVSRPITGERYISAGWLEREFEILWPRVWQFACLERDLAEPGEYRVFNLGRESVLISRTAEGDLTACYNVCQHRGARVMVNDHGWVRNFVCPYHGWTYDWRGRLVDVPDRERFTGGVDAATHSLQPVRVDTWAGLVWICMDPHTPPLLEYLGPAAERVAPYRLEAMTLTGDQTVQLDCNWKAIFDNFQELYHVEHIHPQHAFMFDCPTAEVHLFGNGHTGLVIDGHTVNTRLPVPDEPNPYLARQLVRFGADPAAYRGRVLDIRGDIPALRRAAGPRLGYDYSTLSDLHLADIEQYNFFPNTMITVQPEDVIVMRARPHPTDPDRCWWDKITLHLQPDPAVALRAGVAFEPADAADLAPVARPPHDEFTQEDVIAGRKTMTATIDQDVHLIRDVQAGMHSRGFSAQKLCDDEARVQHYHDWMDHFMRRD
jgi:phenylpropionate dioxygenase-like ring-hydroxylating dioxygenase large terminal subunit